MNSRYDDKNKFLFQAIAESVSLYGIAGLQFILLNLKDENIGKIDVKNHSLTDLFSEINRAIEVNGIDHVIYMIQNKKNRLPKYTEKLRHTKKLNQKVFDVVCKTFETEKESIINDTDRKGNRIYASGTIIKIFSEILDYSVEEIQELLPKSKSLMSKHKIRVSNLDYKHPFESDFFKKYFFCKHQIINFILNQD